MSGTYANGTPSAVTCTWNPGAIAGTVSGATISGGTYSQTCTTPVAGTYSLVVTGTGANTATDTHTGIVLSTSALSSASCSGFSCATTTSSTVTVTFAYTGSAPTGATYLWNSTCSGSGTGGAFTASAGTGSFTVTAPAAACTGTMTATGTGPNTGSATTASVTVTAPASYVGPGDVSGATYTGFWSPGRAVTAARRGNPVADICLTATPTTCVAVSSDATTGIAAAPTSLGGTDCTAIATNCQVARLYDGLGGTNHFLFGLTGRPYVIARNGAACMRTVPTHTGAAGVPFATGPGGTLTHLTVAKRDTITGGGPNAGAVAISVGNSGTLWQSAGSTVKALAV